MGKVCSFVIALGIFAVFGVGAAATIELTITGLTFTDHLSAGMIEQDVFVEKAAGSSDVYRVGPDEKNIYLDHLIFAAAKPVHHAPFNPRLKGPHPKGRALGITLKEWVSGTGSATYTCRAGEGILKASFEKLVPNGLYTMWYAMAAKSHMDCPNCAFATLDIPVGAADGSDSAFRADARGNARYEVTTTPCLPLGNDHIVPLLAIAYHSDGTLYEEQPGDLGRVAHVQLFVALPDEGSWARAGK